MSPSKPRSLAPKSAAALSGVTGTGSFGLMIEVNGYPITINTAALKSLATDGITFNYDRDPPQELGTLNGLVSWLGSQVGVPELMQDIEAAPFVGPIIKKLDPTTITAYVEQFDLRIQGSDHQTPPTSFTLAGSVTVQVPPFGPLRITGFTFGASAVVTLST
jgi:hypothetical protein